VNAYCPTAFTRQSRQWFFDHGWIDPSDEETMSYLGPDKMSPFVVFLASDASRDLNGRLFQFVFTSMSTDADYVIKEVFVAETAGVAAKSWTADEIEQAAGSFLRTSPSQGDWYATIEGQVGIPAGAKGLTPTREG
jgi:hypothetical protein